QQVSRNGVLGSFTHPLSNGSVLSAAGHERVAADLGNRCRAPLRHHHLQLAAQERYYCFHALLPKGGESTDVRTPDANRRGPQRQGLENVRASAKTAVDENRYFAGSSRNNFRQAFNRSAGAGILMAAVIGDNDAV